MENHINRRSDAVNIALFLGSSSLSYLSHTAFIYTMVVVSREASGSNAVTGTTYFCLSLPVILLTLLAGVLADQRSRRSILILCQAGIAALTCAGALLLREEWIRPGSYGWLFAVALGYGLLASIIVPARLAMVGNVAQGETCQRVMVGINILQFVALGAGPALAGFLRAHGSWALVLAGCGALGLCSGGLIWRVHERYPQAQGERRSPWVELKAGLAMLFGNVRLLQLCGVAMIISVCVFGMLQVLMPEYARSVLGLDEQQRGLFQLPFGVGLLAGGGLASAVLRSRYRGWLILGSTAVGCATIMVLPLSRSAGPAAGLLLAAGTCGGMALAMLTASLQALTANAYRGRVMSVFSWILTGMSATGGWLFGVVAEASSVSRAIQIAGGVALGLMGYSILGWHELRALRATPMQESARI